MSTELATLGSGNFQAMAQAMGLGAEVKAKSSQLPRLSIFSEPVMGTAEVNGKKKKVEVIEAGTFVLEQVDGTKVYAEEARIRIFAQRFMYKRWLGKGDGFRKTVMADDLNRDLKDNKGGFNCGRPSGYIEDWNALPKDQRDLIMSCKRTRSLFGEVELINPVNSAGEPVEIEGLTPFIFETSTKKGFPAMAPVFKTFMRQKLLPLQRFVHMKLEGEEIPNGNMTHWPVPSIEPDALDISEADQATFQNFIDWIDGYNDYIIKDWNENAKSLATEDEVDVAEEFVEIEAELVESDDSED